MSRRILAPRLALLAVMAGLLIVVAPLAPVWPLTVVAGILLAIAIVETVWPASTPEHEDAVQPAHP